MEKVHLRHPVQKPQDSAYHRAKYGIKTNRYFFSNELFVQVCFKFPLHLH